MSRLTQSYNTFSRVLETFGTAIDLLPLQEYGATIYRVFRDSEIKRFEYSYELLWRYLKRYLQEVHGLLVQSPRTVFRECYAAGITTESETEALLEMIIARNKTAHTYQEKYAEELVQEIPQFYVLMKNIADKIVPEDV